MKQWLGLMVLSGLLATGLALAQEPAAEEHPAAPAEVQPAHVGEQDAVHAEPMGEHGAPAHREAAHGEAAAHGGGHGEGHGGGNVAAEVAEHIIHHVSDDTSWTLEIPVPPFEAFTIDLAPPFRALLIEREPGACALPVSAQLAPFPGIGQWLNGCWDFRPTKSLLMIWIAMALLGVMLFFGMKRDAHGVPQGVVSHVVESLLLFVRDDIAIPNIGKEQGPAYTPYLATCFFFIMFIDYLGLFPGMFAGTGVLSVTLALAVVTFLVTQYAGLKSAGVGGYLGHLTGGVPVWMWPVMIPVEIVGLFTKPFALMVRLFANMLAGHMVLFFLLSLIFVWHVAAAGLSVPMAAAIYLLELFVAILQAYIFTLLTALFIGQGVAMGHHHDEAHGHGAEKAH